MLMTGVHKDAANADTNNGTRLYSAYKVAQEVDMQGLEPLYDDTLLLLEKLSPAQHRFFLDACEHYGALIDAEEAAFSRVRGQAHHAPAFHKSKPVVPRGLPNNGVSLNYRNPLHQDRDLATMCFVCRDCDRPRPPRSA